MATSPMLALSAIDVTRVGSLVELSIASVSVSPLAVVMSTSCSLALLTQIGDPARRDRARLARWSTGWCSISIRRSRAAASPARARRAVRPGVVGDVAVEALVLPLKRRVRELELRGPQLLHAGAAAREIDRALELGDLPHRQLAVRHGVLADVRRRALALDDDGLRRLETILAAERRRRIIDRLLLGRDLRASRLRTRSQERSGSVS